MIILEMKMEELEHKLQKQQQLEVDQQMLLQPLKF